MQKRVISNQFVLMDDEEWQYYQEICRSYDKPPSVKGSELFADLIVSDDDGIITYVKAPSVRQTSMEIWLFLNGIFTRQQMRLMRGQVDNAIAEFKTNSAKMLEEIRSEALKQIENQKTTKKASTK